MESTPWKQNVPMRESVTARVESARALERLRVEHAKEWAATTGAAGKEFVCPSVRPR